MNDKSVVFIIILIAIITVASILLFTHNLDEITEKEEFCVEGWVTQSYIEATINISNESVDIWYITLNDNYGSTNGTTYLMVFTGDLSAPPTNVEIRCYYETYNYVVDGETKEVYEIYRVKSL